VYGLLYALHLRDHEEEDAERYRGLYAARSQQFGADPPRQLDVLAGYLMDVGLPAEAAQLLERAVKLAPGDLDRQDRLGQALFDARRNEDAESLYARLLEEHPSFAKAHLMMARIGERRGRSKEAVLHYERFLASRPRGPEADEAQRRLEHLRSAQSPTP
jgi:tetratricopeptide (TPR) repeat protein